MSFLFKCNEYLQPPSIRGQSALETDWDKCNKLVPEKVIIKSIRNGLHETMQDELDVNGDNYFLVSDESFN